MKSLMGVDMNGYSSAFVKAPVVVSLVSTPHGELLGRLLLVISPHRLGEFLHIE